MKNKWLAGVFIWAGLLPAATALAQEAGARPNLTERLGDGALSTVVYGILGIALAALGYKVFEVILPFSVKHELAEDHNMSVGLLMASVVLGISIVVAMTIHS